MSKYLQILTGMIILAAVMLNAGSVISRYVFNSSFVWSDEILVFANIITIAVGALVAAIGGAHLSIDVISAHLPQRAERIRAMIVELLTFIVLGAAAYASLGAIKVVGKSGQASVAAGVPMWVPHGSLLLSFAGLALIAAFRLMRVCLGSRKK